MLPDPNPSNYMNDNHIAVDGTDGYVQGLMDYTGADHVFLFQTWHILTGGWDSLNHWPCVLDDDYDDYNKYPSHLRHALGRPTEGWSFSHIFLITYERHMNYPLEGDIFIRVWKNNATCGCNGPSYL